MKTLSALLPLLVFLAAMAWAQDAVEVKTTDGASTPQIRMAFNSGSTVGYAEIRNARLQLGSAGYLNVTSSAASTPVAGDLRYDSGTSTLRYYDGAWKTVTTTSSASAFVQGGNAFGTLATLGTTDAQALAFVTAGSERMRLTSGGYLGIGTTGPTAALHVVPPTPSGQLTVGTAGTWGTGSSNSEDPLNTFYHDCRAQTVYLASDLTAAGYSAGNEEAFS